MFLEMKLDQHYLLQCYIKYTDVCTTSCQSICIWWWWVVNGQCIFTAQLWRNRLRVTFGCHLFAIFSWLFAFPFAYMLLAFTVSSQSFCDCTSQTICFKTWIFVCHHLEFVWNKWIYFPQKYCILFADLLFPRICVQTSPTCELTKELNTGVKMLKPCTYSDLHINASKCISR